MKLFDFWVKIFDFWVKIFGFFSELKKGGGWPHTQPPNAGVIVVSCIAFGAPPCPLPPAEALPSVPRGQGALLELGGSGRIDRFLLSFFDIGNFGRLAVTAI